MSMRLWPGKIEVIIKHLPVLDNGSPAKDFVESKETFNVGARCADDVLKKVKEHVTEKMKGKYFGTSLYFKFGPVLWYPSEEKDSVVVDF